MIALPVSPQRDDSSPRCCCRLMDGLITVDHNQLEGTLPTGFGDFTELIEFMVGTFFLM